MGTITDIGLEYAAKLLNGVSMTPFNYMAIGSGTTAEATNQTGLAAEMSGGGANRKQATVSYEADQQKSVWQATFNNTSGGQWNVNEIAILDASVGGHMLARHKFPSTKIVDDGGSISVTVKSPNTRG